MALISKTNRCVVCGSSEVVFDKESGLYRCATCGAESKELMPVSDAAAINRIALLGDDEGRLEELRQRYPRLCRQAQRHQLQLLWHRPVSGAHPEVLDPL